MLELVQINPNRCVLSHYAIENYYITKNIELFNKHFKIKYFQIPNATLLADQVTLVKTTYLSDLHTEEKIASNAIENNVLKQFDKS